jgi:dihydroorotate dehydrogenase (NAD+) catalytic subunit
MLNSVGIQNPGITKWVDAMKPRIPKLAVPVWGSAVADAADGFALVAKGLVSAGVTAVEVNLSCPNLEDGEMFSFTADRSRDVITAVSEAVNVPVGAKLSPNTPDIVGVAGVCRDAGAAFVVLTNTAFGFGLSVSDRRPLLSGGVGGYSGPGLKPLSLRCVYEVARAMPDLGIIGCGGISTGADVVEYLMAGASAVELGTVHLAEPKAGIRITKELVELMARLGIESVADLVGTVQTW